MMFDPTGTIRLRQSFRVALRRRAQMLLRLTRSAVIEQDMLGTRPIAPPALASLFKITVPANRAAKLTMFNSWFNNAAEHTVTKPNVEGYLLQAYKGGRIAGASFTNTAPGDDDVDQFYVEHTRNELRGIVAATMQQVGRRVSLALRHQTPPQITYRAISKAVKQTAIPRMNSLANVMVVSLHNKGRLDEFRANGIVRVGIRAENKPLAVHDHARHVRDEESMFANIQTAGDDKVCQECQDAADAGPYTLDEAEDLVPLHPDCRCAVVPAGEFGDRVPMHRKYLAMR